MGMNDKLRELVEKWRATAKIELSFYDDTHKQRGNVIQKCADELSAVLATPDDERPVDGSVVDKLIESAKAWGHHSVLRGSSDETIAYWGKRTDSLRSRLTVTCCDIPTPPTARPEVEEVDLCEVAAELEVVHAQKVIADVAALAGDRTDAYWAGHANACEEIAYRLKHGSSTGDVDAEQAKAEGDVSFVIAPVEAPEWLLEKMCEAHEFSGFHDLMGPMNAAYRMMVSQLAAPKPAGCEAVMWISQSSFDEITSRVPALSSTICSLQGSKSKTKDRTVPLYAQPQAVVVDDAMVERFCFAWWPTWSNPALRTDTDRERVRDCLLAALAPGGRVR